MEEAPMDAVAENLLIRYVLLLFALEFFLRGITGLVTIKWVAAAIWLTGGALIGVAGLLVYRRLRAMDALQEDGGPTGYQSG